MRISWNINRLTDIYKAEFCFSLLLVFFWLYQRITMTTPSTWIPIFFLTLFSLQFLPSFPFHSNSTLLDHTTIVKQTMNFISSNFNFNSTSTTPFLSFPIYHIEYFIQSQFKNHSSLLQARLARDQARHKYLTSLFNPVNLNASTVSEVASGTDFFF